MVADDDRDTSAMLATILRDEGHEVHTALRGDEVLDLDRLVRPDVLILDLNMPGMSGYAVAREIRERRVSLVPMLIAISGKWKEKPEQALSEEIGFDHHLLKPCQPREVVRLVNEFSRQR